MITVVPATEALLREFYGDKPWPTMQAWIVMEDGKPITVGGFLRVRQNMRMLFCDTTDEARMAHKITAVKFTKMLLKIADEHGWTLIADPDANISTAPHFLEHFGFKPGLVGEYVRWPV